MANNLNDANLCLSQAKSLDALSSVLKRGFKQLNIVGGNTPMIIVSSDKVYKLPITPEAIKAISSSMSGVLDGAVLGLISQAKGILSALSTPTPATTPPVATMPVTTTPTKPVVTITPTK